MEKHKEDNGQACCCLEAVYEGFGGSVQIVFE